MSTNQDEFEWLETVEGKEALEWVRSHNVVNTSPEFLQVKQRLCEILDSDNKIPYVEKGPDGLVYNLWKDKTNKLGLWRRTTFDEYQKKDTKWEIILDIDLLSKQEGKTWVWHGAKFLSDPKDGSYRCLVNLSRGGADADETREFDLTSKTWVTLSVPEGVADLDLGLGLGVGVGRDRGFFRPEAKGGVSWKDADTVYVYTDFGSNTLTDSGYPRIVKEWKRGQDLKDAFIIYEGQQTDMYIAAVYNRSCKRSFVSRTIAFYNDELYLLNDDKTLTLLQVPNSANKEVQNDFLFLELRTSWKGFAAGSLIATGLTKFLTDQENAVWETLFSPTEDKNVTLSSFCFTKNYVIMNLLDNVKSKIVLATPSDVLNNLNRVSLSDTNDDHKVSWLKKEFKTKSGLSNIVVSPVDSEEEDTFFLTLTNFLTPSTLSLVDLSPLRMEIFPTTVDQQGHLSCVMLGQPWMDLETAALRGTPRVERLKSLPSFFDSSHHLIEQLWSVSDDGTKIPYFCVRPKDMEFDSLNPTLLYGYGGFEVSILPNYSAGLGAAWLDHSFANNRRGVYVVANIRGGAEFGPSWHQAALKANRHRAYEDFSSVAKDLVHRKITQAKLLGCTGASNGGLLTGNMLTQYPELFGAIVIQVPLLDMLRYHKLLAGASWMAEYGNPDLPEEWAFIKTFSPYHLLQTRPDLELPPTLITTSTRDDRVHPGHARKMVALMLKLNKDITYYENIEGGHGGAANSEQQAHMLALLYSFLQEKLRL